MQHDSMSAVRDAASQASEFLKRQADRRSREIGGRLNAAADDLESAGEDMNERGQEFTASVARQLASVARRAGFYLETTDTSHMLEDAREFTREQPWTVVAIGMVAGFALSRVVKHALPDNHRRAD
jgi:ElaB/YqjD/DUF883 family membrane-anchored ribosome-binding protein